ncbi:citrate/2-methylcitrate synthase [Virgibacillus sp. C22-A2]|uniref:Citrate synthase n=1 Tax=Virgibacillus tibetensis TaxID=3042313 RepID=A0ABU6KC87_9BACI|nr:citrate/2-methylcitrate synthase [Virgibacillus sp. C22-A2]
MFKPGLKGIEAVETEISQIDGKKGVLTYRGVPIQQIIGRYTFEETAYYLLYASFPTESELTTFQNQLKEFRCIPAYVKLIIDQLPSSHSIMDVLRTAVSSLTVDKEHTAPVSIIAVLPTIIAYRYRKLNNKPVIVPDSKLNHVDNFLYMLTEKMDPIHTGLLETYMVMTMEHGLNASAFSARVTISTESDFISAVTSALGTMKGPLHGGAPSGVLELLDQIKTKECISEVIHKKLKNKERIMGFGHRVYKTVDPRAEALKSKILEFEKLPKWMDLALQTEKKTIEILDEFKPEQKLYTNVEYYAAAIMKSIDLDPELFTAIFSASRIVGWCAHIIEQSNNNTIFRPTVKYIGN